MGWQKGWRGRGAQEGKWVGHKGMSTIFLLLYLPYQTEPLPALPNAQCMGMFGTHHHPFGLCFNMMGVFLTSPSPPSYRNVRRGVCSTHHPFGSCFNTMGVPLTSQNPLLCQNVRWGVCSSTTIPLVHISMWQRCPWPLKTLPRIEMQDGERGLAHPPPPFGSHFDVMGVFTTYPYSSLPFRHLADIQMGIGCVRCVRQSPSPLPFRTPGVNSPP